MSHIDAEYLQELYKADHGLIEKMKHAFLLHGAESLNSLLDFSKSKNFEKLDFDLHKFKSQCQSAGVLTLEPIFSEIILLSKKESEENIMLISNKLKDVQKISESVFKELKNNLKG